MNYLPVAEYDKQVQDSQLFLTSETGNTENIIQIMLPNKSNQVTSFTNIDSHDVMEMTENDNGVAFSNSSTVVQIDTIDGIKAGQAQVDGGKNAYASKKSVAEGMMDIALLTANANQLRFLITYNQESKTYFVSFGLIVLSLILQVAVGIALIFKVWRQMKIRGRKSKADRTNDFLVGGVFLITVINVFAASFTMTETPKH